MRMNVRRSAYTLAIASAFTGLCALVQAQTPKAFEVAAIRPLNRPYSSPGSSRVTPGRFEITGVSARELIGRSFGMERQQWVRTIVGAPDWAVRETFEIRAVMPASATERDVPEMLKTLLAERFRFSAHIEQRPLAVYELIVLPSGPKFKEVAAVNDLAKPFPGARGDNTSGLPGDEVRYVSSPETGFATLTITSRSSYLSRNVPPNGGRQLEAARITMPEFGWQLQPSLDRPFVDKTGLTGVYEIKVLLPPPRTSPNMQAVVGDRLDSSPSGISMDRVLEGLGLKLEPKTAPVDFVVIDRIERPTND